MKRTLVMFGASWCAPCKATKPHAEAVARELGVEFEYVDVEFSDSRANDVTAVPTLRVYDDQDDVLAEHRGGANAAQLRALIEGAA